MLVHVTSRMRSSAVNVAIREVTGYFSLQAAGKKGDTFRTT